MPAQDGLVRAVRIKTKTNMLIRPVDKLCLLLEAEIPETEVSTTAATEPRQPKESKETTAVKKDSNQRPRRKIKAPQRLDL